MFRKEDYLEYLGEMLKIEQDMGKILEELIDLMEDEKPRDILRLIREDETRHSLYIKHLIELIDLKGPLYDRE